MSYQVYTIDEGGRNAPKTLSVVKTFDTREQAQKFFDEFSKDPAYKQDPKGIRQTPTTPEPIDERTGDIVVGSGKSDRGSRLQKQRRRAERIERQAVTTDIPLTPDQKTILKRAGVTGEQIQISRKRFKVQESQRFQENIFFRQRQSETFKKQEAFRRYREITPFNESPQKKDSPSKTRIGGRIDPVVSRTRFKDDPKRFIDERAQALVLKYREFTSPDTQTRFHRGGRYISEFGSGLVSFTEKIGRGVISLPEKAINFRLPPAKTIFSKATLTKIDTTFQEVGSTIKRESNLRPIAFLSPLALDPITRGGTKAVKFAEIQGLKKAPVEIKYQSTGVKIKTLTNKDKSISQIDPIGFAGKIKGQEFKGTGGGFSATKDKDFSAGAFKFTLEPTGKRIVPKAIDYETAFKSLVQGNKGDTKTGVIITQTRREGAKTTTKLISPFREQKIVEGDLITTATKTGNLQSSKKRFGAQSGSLILTKDLVKVDGRRLSVALDKTIGADQFNKITSGKNLKPIAPKPKKPVLSQLKSNFNNLRNKTKEQPKINTPTLRLENKKSLTNIRSETATAFITSAKGIVRRGAISRAKTKIKQKPALSVSFKSGSSIISDTTTKSDTSFKTRPSTRPITGQEQRIGIDYVFRTRPTIGQIPRQNIIPITTQTYSPIIQDPTNPRKPPTTPLIPPTTPKIPFKLPKLKLRYNQPKKSKTTKKRRLIREYKPTLTTAGFTIIGKPTKAGIKSGLGIRPIKIKR